MGFTIYGGQLRPGISLSIEGSLPVSDEQVKQNQQHSASLGLATYREAQTGGGKKLAVVGGGPSVRHYIDELRAFDGDIWAINGAWKWVTEGLGREATFISCDPHPIVATWAQGAKRALLESRCHPDAFAALKDAEVITYDVGGEPGQLRCGSMTVTATPHLAARMGYGQVFLYGCEGSYPMGQSHAYMNEGLADEMMVMCGLDDMGHDAFFLTRPDFYLQCCELSTFIRQCFDLAGKYVVERSGGLLKAMVENEQHFIVWVSESLGKQIDANAAKAAEEPPVCHV